LQDQSMLYAIDSPDLGERRLALLESIRDYAAEKLKELGTRPIVFERYAEYYVRKAIEWSRRATSLQGRRRLLAELDNLSRAVAYRCREQASIGDDTLAIEALVALEPVFMSQGPIPLYESLLDAVLVGAAGKRPQLAVARALRVRGWSRLVLGRGEVARSVCAVGVGWCSGAVRKRWLI
jgi:predicted ATPase